MGSRNERFPLTFRGNGSEFFLLILKNLLFTIATFGIYYPWARTERRKYIIQNTYIGEHPLRYHGTGRELFYGYLKVALGYLGFSVFTVVLRNAPAPVASAIFFVLYLFFLFVVMPLAMHSARKYLMSRVSWRGVHFGFDNCLPMLIKQTTLYIILSVLTLGLYLPIWNFSVLKILSEHSRFGNKRFVFEGKSSDFYALTMKNFLLCVVTLGLFFPFAVVRKHRYCWENLEYQGMRFHYRLTGLKQAQLFLLHIVGIPLSLGLLFPWIQAYSLRVTLGAIEPVGNIDFTRIGAEKSTGRASGDSLADMMNVVLDVGI